MRSGKAMNEMCVADCRHKSGAGGGGCFSKGEIC